ncbi:DHS-like NAD/FAD-binding domain-containing protein [Cenococcum geophilum]
MPAINASHLFLAKAKVRKNRPSHILNTLIKKELSIKKNIVIISGAGISTNAGIDDFYSFLRTKRLSQNLFHLSIYYIPKRATYSSLILLNRLIEAWAQYSRVNTLKYSIRSQHTFLNKQCLICEREQRQRELEGKRIRLKISNLRDFINRLCKKAELGSKEYIKV